MVKVSIGDMEKLLLEQFPASHALEWDNTGLLVGNPHAIVEKVLIALDSTVENIRYAKKIGANVLLTHHPCYIENPTDFLPGESAAKHKGSVVFEAIEQGVALMNFHTALDVSPKAYRIVPKMLGFKCMDVLQPLNDELPEYGYGVICKDSSNLPQTVSSIIKRCKECLGSSVVLWGSGSQVAKRIVWAQGSARSIVPLCAQHEVDCLICGELDYHSALDLSSLGISCLIVGHDVSENPFILLLKESVKLLDIPDDAIECVLRHNWTVA